MRSQGESGQAQASICAEFPWRVGYAGRTDEWAEYSLGREELGSPAPDFHPEGRRDFCPHLIWIGSVSASVHDGYF